LLKCDDRAACVKMGSGI